MIIMIFNLIDFFFSPYQRNYQWKELIRLMIKMDMISLCTKHVYLANKIVKRSSGSSLRRNKIE